MRIAVYHNLPSGGAKRSLLEFTRRLASRHTIDVFTLSCAEHEFADLRPVANQYHITPFNPLRLLRSPFGRLNQTIYLADILRLDEVDQKIAAKIDHLKYDVVFIHHCRYRQSPGVLRYLKTPTVYYCQEPPRKIYDPPIPRAYDRKSGHWDWLDNLDPLPRIYLGTLRRRDQKNVKSCGHILVNSHHSRENIWRVYKKQPTVCYLGVDSTEFKPQDCPKEFMVLSVGTINPIKGYDLLIKGIARLPRNTRPPLVIISNYSDPQEKSYLQQLADKFGVSISIKPIINSSQELSKWYSRAQVTGYTPILEPLGLVALESMACETPVIGVREGGVRETVVDGVTGRLVDRHPDSVADALDELFSQTEKAKAMGKQGRTWIMDNWTWENSAKNIEKALISSQNKRQIVN